MLKDNSLCENRTIHATNGINYIICIPFSTINNLRVYSYPEEIKVTGGTLKKFALGSGFGYEFIKNGCDESSDLLNFVTKNGYSYSGCFKFTVDAKGNKEYIYPATIKVQHGYLRKVPDTSLRAGWNYYYEADNAKKTSEDKGDKTNGSSSSSGQIIEGVDNSVLAIAGIGLFLMLN